MFPPTRPLGIAVGRIAVLRANRIGDFIITLPALAALRAAFPAAEIILLGRPWHAAFLAGRAGPIDRVVVIPPCRGVGELEDYRDDPVALARFFAALVREKIDLALQLHGGGRFSNPFIARLGARLTAGLRAGDAAPLDRWLPYDPDQHEILRFLEVAALVGAPPVTLEPRLELTTADRDEAARALPDDGRMLVALHPGASDPRRRWPVARFAAVGDALARQGARVLLVGDAGETGVTAAVAGAMATPAVDLASRLSLGGLAGLLARCRVVVGNDSGPLHIAAAVGAATVGFYWGRNLAHYGPLTRTRHRPLASWRESCPVCGLPLAAAGCRHDASWVADVPVADAVAAAHALFAAPDSASPAGGIASQPFSPVVAVPSMK